MRDLNLLAMEVLSWQQRPFKGAFAVCRRRDMHFITMSPQIQGPLHLCFPKALCDCGQVTPTLPQFLISEISMLSVPDS